MLRTLMATAVLAAFASAQAQDKPAPAPAQPWQQGRSAEQMESPLHPFAPNLTGRAAKDLPIDTLKVPAGFKVEVWADGVPEARSLALGDKGTVFVSNRISKNVYAVIDRGGQREVKTILKGMNAPNGIVFSKGTLYVAERNRITSYADIENHLDNPGEGKVVVDNLDPTTQPGHFWKFLAMGPDNKLYFNIGSPQNITMPTYMQASIMRVDPKTGVVENYAQGVRNSVGFDWSPKTHQLWFTVHGRDWLGDDSPADMLEVATRPGQHFGFPYCHEGDMLDPEYGKNRSCKEFTPPAAKLGAHVAPLGMRFYTGKMFPAEYQGNIFIAQHGSWNRTTKQGYNVIRVVVDGKNKVVKSEPFLTGFLTNDKGDPPMWGRPVDVLVMKDGALLVSDDYNGILYRISYKK
ncbi:MAG TPA: PQQ-dependent sugar dehydrogenase [Burkholderiales bacterium]|nr:PQQ-dependent sugar dehydrogenase [Burkholderiales bacterium]